MRFLFALLILAVVLGPLSTHARATDEADVAAEKQWDKDRDQFRKELKKIKQGVLDELTVLEEKARERGDADKVKRIKGEIQAFDERDVFPSSIGRVTYNKRRMAAEDNLQQSFKKVQTALLKAKRDADVEDLQKELKELLGPASAIKPSEGVIGAHRKRWINNSYKTVIYNVSGKKWVEVENQTNKVKWELNETARTEDYIELYNSVRNETWRVLKDGVELRSGPDRKIIAHGQWEEASK